LKFLKQKKSLVFFLLITFLFGGCSFKNKESNKNDVYDYLKENKKVIDEQNLNNFSNLSIMDSDLIDKEIFLTGEWPGVKGNYIMNMNFLKYFKEKANIKYYLCNIPYSYAYFLNIFLQTGNLDILSVIYEPLYGSKIWSKDDYQSWIELYNYNNTLPEFKKISIVGIGLEVNAGASFSYMDMVTSDKTAPAEIRNLLSEMKAIWSKSSNKSEIKEACEKMKKDIELREDVYKNFLGEDFLGFKLVNDNLLNTIEAYNLKEKSISKYHEFVSQKVYEGFKQQYSVLEKGKYYGNFPISQVFQNEQDNVRWLAAAINEDMLSLKNKVFSIAYAYDNCKYMIKGTKYTTSSLSTFDEILNNLQGIATEKYTLFKLNNRNSPFSKQLIWLISGSDIVPNSKSTTDYYQYLLVIKNSEASEPLTKIEK